MKHKLLQSVLFKAIGIAAISTAASAQVIYVDDSALPGGNGTSWTQAYQNLDSALGTASSTNDICVAEGTYKPSIATVIGDPRSVTFDIPSGVRLFGAFKGTETSVSGRLGDPKKTILNGDVGVQGLTSDNTYHVVTIKNNPFGATLNGFKVSDGNALGAVGSVDTGGGIMVDNGGWVRLTDCHILNNAARRGGGVGFTQLAKANFKRCTIRGNYAEEKGGGVYSKISSLLIVNCLIDGNDAGLKGGGLFMKQATNASSNLIVNTRFLLNTAGNLGGAVFLGAGQGETFILNPAAGTFSNCTFAGNSAGSQGGSVHAANNTTLSARCLIQNSISWGNSAPTDPEFAGSSIVADQDIVQGGWPGTGNLSTDPLFVNLAVGNVNLSLGSPAINSGLDLFHAYDFLDIDDDGNYAELIPLDLNDLRRVAQGTIDRGAYEYQ